MRDRIVTLIRNNIFVVWFRLLVEIYFEYLQLAKHLGAVRLKKNKRKLEADIIIRSHAIEKGLSMVKPRPGFGEKKVSDLIQLLHYYYNKFGSSNFLTLVIPILESYFEFNRNQNSFNNELWLKFEEIRGRLSLEVTDYVGGIIWIEKEDTLNSLNQGFPRVASSRYSIRDFSDQKIDMELIYKALEIARKSPSACNRQPWRVYVYRNEKKKKDLLKWQGNKGFIDNIDTVIIVSCSLNSFFINEKHQAYIDGGLYSMTLLYALHSMGLGTIPMTMAMMHSKRKDLYTHFGLQQDEVPIVMIGVGALKDKYPVAISDRKKINEYLTVFE
ncbi:nitroreductase family protein [Geofilum rubicundum]|uniref:Nitroreductase domain-containing protein n=1 Tax=Geofilum rubicundum JCM 15548 TaxID=1236989 RepID=A0A0E9M103_9BACT|nr:nitroreductase family protein [Geofilum rubicundum]GAO31482.1 hypothetical protein JCM15548_13846 [Geofilum rubicundum JCM 15548]